MTTSLQQLADKLGKTVWTKGDMQRIYMNEAGWNTKKMSTKTYIYQRENGSFGVSCFIECPSQPFAWIKSQQEEVIASIESMIEKAFSETVFLLTNKEGKVCNYKGEQIELCDANAFFTEKEAKEEIDNCLNYYGYIPMNRNEFESIVNASMS